MTTFLGQLHIHAQKERKTHTYSDCMKTLKPIFNGLDYTQRPEAHRMMFLTTRFDLLLNLLIHILDPLPIWLLVLQSIDPPPHPAYLSPPVPPIKLH